MATVEFEPAKPGTMKGLSSPVALSVWAERGRSLMWLEVGVGVALLAIAALTAFILLNQDPQDSPLAPHEAAALLVVNLLPATAMLVLIGRRLALSRAREANVASRELIHVRLVAIFSLIAAIPTLLLVIFASFLFQTGVQFWFSDSARDMLVNAGELASGYYDEKRNDVGAETLAMAGDLRYALSNLTPDDPAFLDGYYKQVLGRKLSESAIVTMTGQGKQQTIAVVSPDDKRQESWIDSTTLQTLDSGEPMVVKVKKDGIVAVTLLFDAPKKTFLYAKRSVEVPSLQLGTKAQSVLNDYRTMVRRSQQLQFQFNIALYVISLLIIAIVVWVALLVADRLIAPVNNLVATAQQIADGNLSARVEEDSLRQDEVAQLSRAFNIMTGRLQDQTGTLVNANRQLDDRRAFIEAVLESVSSGVISIDQDGQITLANSTAEKLLGSDTGSSIIGSKLAKIAPRFAQLIEEQQYSAVVQMGDGPEPQTLAIKLSEREAGFVVTFEDITQQLSDQRRAAWSDVARRIAHEIKNPLTPIQLAAERLQRRFTKMAGAEEDDREVFEQLTATIIRQVGDLRKIADEFSSFARMPKPVLREENLTDIVGHAVFLFEVAHEDIQFTFEKPKKPVSLICDRRQLGQAITNLLKNASEAIAERIEAEGGETGKIAVTLSGGKRGVSITVGDNGVGFPADRERIIEPYVTTRKTGSGLGLAIVQKIIEEHFGEIRLADGKDGGASVTILLDRQLLAANAASLHPIQKSREVQE